MNIIKRGSKPSDKIWKGICHTCDTVATAKAAELKLGHCQRDGSFGHGTCPVCDDKYMVFYPLGETR